MEKKIIVVGGVAGGATAVARMRRLDENAEIICSKKEHTFPLLIAAYPIISVE